jgi:serine protease Do
MKTRTPIFFLFMLLAGVLMGLVSNAWAQDSGAPTQDRMVRVRVDGGSFLGIGIEEVTSDAAQRLNLREERGALITSVVPDSPAAKAGLQKDDVIVRWNGTTVESAAQLRRHVRETPAGRTARLEVVRNKHEIETKVTLGKPSAGTRRFDIEVDKQAMESAREAFESAREGLKSGELSKVFMFSNRARMGTALQNLTPQLAEYFGVKEGVLISSVRQGSPAERAGLKAGDVIIAIDGDKIGDPGDAMRAIARKEEGPVEVRAMRERREMTFTVTLEKQEKPSNLFAPDIDIDFEPLMLREFPNWSEAPGEEVIASPPAARSTPRVRVRPARPARPIRTLPGVI